MVRASAADSAVATEALVLRRISYGETDLVLHFATRELGRIACFARAAKRSRQRFPSGFPSFALLEIHVAPPRRVDAMRPVLDAAVLRPHLAIADDLPRYAAAGLLVEIARETMPEDQPEPAAFAAVADYLDELERAPFDWAGLLDAEMRLLATLGLAPRLGRCLSCDTPAPPRRAAFFDARRGGIVCRRCGGADRTLAGGARELMLSALEPASAATPLEEAARTAKPATLASAHLDMLAFLEHHVGRRFRSARLLAEVTARR
jgi:DNA repair protein RecO (recombination protein O)